MEIIILISVYLLSVLITRYTFIKISETNYKSMFISLIPILNLFFSLACFYVYADEKYNFNIERISDWFFGIKEKD